MELGITPLRKTKERPTRGEHIRVDDKLEAVVFGNDVFVKTDEGVYRGQLLTGAAAASKRAPWANGAEQDILNPRLTQQILNCLKDREG